MLTRKMGFLCLAVTLGVFLVCFCGSSAFATIPGCSVADMQAIAPQGPWPLTITSATDVAANGATPEYCDVVGYVTTNYEGAGPGKAGFEAGFPNPNIWNGKYLFLGNGGLAGLLSLTSISPSAIPGLQQGYTVATTDMGHTSTNGFDGTWALKAPGEPNMPALIDYYYRATHETALVGKQFAKAYYQKKLSEAYYEGCSTGGRQGLVEAERYPSDFDGIIAGDPVAGFAHQAPSNTAAEFAFIHPSTAWLPPALWPVVDAAIYAKCDPNNVGLIQDPADCSFNPWTLLCNGKNAGSCLTQEQVKGLIRYASPLLDQHGNIVMPGYPLADIGRSDGGAPIMTLGLSQPSADPTNPEPWTGFTPIHWAASDGTFPYFVFLTESYNQQDFPIWFVHNHGVVADWALRLNDQRTDFGDATHPRQINDFVADGKKMILYHGFSDPLISPYQTIQLYKDMATVTRGGYHGLQENVRLFMVPGMLHCQGGPGPYNFDMLTALNNWVTQGKAPNAIMASGTPTPNCPSADITRTMPLCMFPEEATYTGSGDICDGANWVCSPQNHALLKVGYDGRLAGLPFTYLRPSKDHRWNGR